MNEPELKFEGEYSIAPDGKITNRTNTYDIKMSGQTPTGGYLTYENNILKDGCIIIDEYQVVITNSEVTKVENGTCNILESGSEYELGGYNWHVISDDGIYLTLLMDLGENGHLKLPNDPNGNLNSGNMAHCTDDNNPNTDCNVNGSSYIYSWDKSLIQTYLNTTFYNDIKSKINKEIITTTICNDPNSELSYGGYIKEEIENLDGTCNNYSDYKVRLISASEYANLSPYGPYINLTFPNKNAFNGLNDYFAYKPYVKKQAENDWLYSKSPVNGWWSMSNTNYGNNNTSVTEARIIYNDGYLGAQTTSSPYFSVRPVITIKK